MKIRQKTILMVLLLSLLLASCGGGEKEAGQYNVQSGSTETAADTQQPGEESEVPGTEVAESIGADQFVILENEMNEEYLALKQLASGREYAYHYSLATRFLDKYGNRAAVSYFVPGRVISVRNEDHQGNVLEVQISDQVWEYSDVTRYSLDEERRIFKIGENRYFYDEDLFIYADGADKKLPDLTGMDTIRLVGMGKRLISVAVTTGHGTLALKNTELFEGSFIQVGSRIFAEITPDMTIEVPEGIHTVTVANNGYGGSAEVTISDGEETELDLEELKGEGPQFGDILFAVDAEGALLRIDGEEMDYSEAIPLQYGVHTLEVSADGYDTYSKKLFVNSKEATIIIELSGGKKAGEETDPSAEALEATETLETTETGAGEETPEPGSLAGSLAGSHTSQGAASGTGAETGGAVREPEDAQTNTSSSGEGTGTGTSTSTSTSSTDYLSTLSELLSILTGESE